MNKRICINCTHKKEVHFVTTENEIICYTDTMNGICPCTNLVLSNQ